jgi:TolA-binding protein/ferric-dicitrate binding protein FerR (iron transport regulator)
MTSGMQRPESERRAFALRELARAAEDPARTSATLSRARVQFLDAIALRHATRAAGLAPLHAMLLGFAASVALVCGALLVRRGAAVPVPRAGGAVTYAVDGRPGAIGAWQSAPPAAPLSLRFSEGTNLVLAANASLRVVQTDEHGATVALERGRLHARVEHREGTHWAVDAGPYHVRVTGTEFDVDWDPGTASFGIQLLAGSVQVTGCNAAGARVARGEALRLHCDSSDSRSVAAGPVAGSAAAGRSEAASEPAMSATALADLPRAPRAPHGRTASPNAGATRAEAAPPAKPASPAPETATSVAGDEHPTDERAPEVEQQRAEVAPALDAATAAHPHETCDRTPDGARATLVTALESGTPDTTWAAIQCARRAGLSGDAERALHTFRDRYGSDPRRAEAAFLLGKLEFSQGAFAAAAKWFDASRREAPRGQFARESAGRLIEAWQRAGDSLAAIRAARQYLTVYPEGPHAGLARSLLAL